MSYGFDSLSVAGLQRVIAKYRQGIADIESGRSNFANGGSIRQNRKWLRQAEAELEAGRE